MDLLDIEVPTIAAINALPCAIAKYPYLATSSSVQRMLSFKTRRISPTGWCRETDCTVMPLLLGLNQERYFLLTEQAIPARQAQELGLLNEMLPRNKLLPRAWTLAEQLAQRLPLVARFTRAILTQQVKRLILDSMGYGLALERLRMVDG